MSQPRACRTSQCGTVAGKGHILRGGRAELRKEAASFTAQRAVFAASSVQLGDKLMLARRALLVAIAQVPLAGIAMARASTESDTVMNQAPGSDE